jgi:hypothetical protein
VAKRQATGEDAVSPHVSLRQAVRPAMVAYGILAREQAAGRAMAEEAQALLDLAAELVRKLGLVHLLTAGAVAADGAGAPAGHADRLVEAYAQSGLAWAKVVSSAAKLAGLLTDEEDWATAGLVADLLTAAGEADVGKHIGAQLRNAERASIDPRIGSLRVHNAMTPAEIRHAVAVLREIGTTQYAEGLIVSRRPFLITSAYTIAHQKQVQAAIPLVQDLVNRNRTLAQSPTLKNHPNYQLPPATLFSQLLLILDMCEVQA